MFRGDAEFAGRPRDGEAWSKHVRYAGLASFEACAERESDFAWRLADARAVSAANKLPIELRGLREAHARGIG